MAGAGFSVERDLEPSDVRGRAGADARCDDVVVVRSLRATMSLLHQLSAATLAAEQFVSVRYLHKLFETQQTTVTEWIRRRQLERCAHDLRDPALATMPIGGWQSATMESDER